MAPNERSALISGLSRIAKNAGWLSGAQLVGDLANLLLFVVIARSYGPHGIGEYSYALGVASLAYAGVSLGLEDLAVRECSRCARSGRGSIIGRLIKVQGLSGLAALGLVAIFVLAVPHDLRMKTLIAVLVVQQMALAFSRTLFSPSFAEQGMSVPAVATVLTRIIGIASALTLIMVFDQDLTVGLIPLAGSALVLVVFSAYSCRRYSEKLSFVERWSETAEFLKGAWPFAGSLFLSLAALRSNFIILTLMLGPAATGVYASAVKLMEAAVLPLGFLGFAAYPTLSKNYRDNPLEFWKAGSRLVAVAGVLGALVAWGLLFIAPFVVVPLFGEKFAESESIVRLLSGVALLTSLSFMLIRLLLASDQHRTRLVIQGIMVGVLLLTTVTATPLMGIDGAVLGMYASVGVAVLLTVFCLGRGFRDQTRATFLKLMVVVAVSFGPGYMLTQASLGIVWPAAVALAALLLAAVWMRLLPKELGLRALDLARRKILGR